MESRAQANEYKRTWLACPGQSGRVFGPRTLFPWSWDAETPCLSVFYPSVGIRIPSLLLSPAE